MRVVPVDVADTDAVRAALAPGAELLWLETPTNPLLEVADLPALVAAGHDAGALVAVDNTFATPLVQRPLEHGADVVVHSVTKYLAGHSDVVLGAAVTADDGLRDRLHRHRTVHGAVPGPAEAWLALRGLRTLHLRVERAGANAAELAARLAVHPAVAGSGTRRCRTTPGTPRRRADARLRGDRRARAGRRRGRRGGAAPGPGCGCTPRAWAGWSRRSSGGGGTPGSPRPCRSPWCGCRSASRTSRISGRTSAAVLDALPRLKGALGLARPPQQPRSHLVHVAPPCTSSTTCSVIGISTPCARASSRIGRQDFTASAVCRAAASAWSSVSP